ncbi:Uncharacterised protein [Mycobacteroides abscessus subsp. abscessus]|nr:Uncharacterised protein [Mycobacteroides abscessus subsp. abscessus]
MVPRYRCGSRPVCTPAGRRREFPAGPMADQRRDDTAGRLRSPQRLLRWPRRSAGVRIPAAQPVRRVRPPRGPSASRARRAPRPEPRPGHSTWRLRAPSHRRGHRPRRRRELSPGVGCAWARDDVEKGVALSISDLPEIAHTQQSSLTRHRHSIASTQSVGARLTVPVHMQEGPPRKQTPGVTIG